MATEMTAQTWRRAPSQTTAVSDGDSVAVASALRLYYDPAPAMTMATEPEQQQQWTGRVLFLCAVLQLLLVHIAYRADRSKRPPLIPTAAWAMFLGVAFGAVLSYASPHRARREGLDPQLLFFGLLPPIVLEAGFTTQRKGLFSNFLAICLLAVVGTLVATVVTGVLVYWIGQRVPTMTALPLTEALLYGALISAIDPVATLVVLKKSHAPPLLFHLLFGESVLNDAIVIVVVSIVQHAALDDQDMNNHWGWRAAELLLQLAGISVGSVLLAAAICYASAFCLRHADAALKQHPTYEVATLLLSAYASFVLCQSLELSGLLAVFFSGVLLRHYHVYSVAHASAAAFTQMLATAAFLAENLIYLYLGASLVAYSDQFVWDWIFIAVSLAATLVARALSTFPLCALANLWRTERIPFRYQCVLWFAGLRGAIAFALALNVRTLDTRDGNDHAAVIRASTLVTVLLTTTVLGAATGPLLFALGLAKHEPSPTQPTHATHSEATPLLAVETLAVESTTTTATTTDSVQRISDNDDSGVGGCTDDGGWSMRRLWVHVDERHLKPLFGGNPRALRSGS